MQEYELVDIQNLDSTILVELKYSTTDNFVGKDMYGSLEKAYLVPKIAKMVVRAQAILKARHPEYSLLIYDAARPISVQRAMRKIVEGTKWQDFVADGTNADDLKEYRPGLRARDEMGVRSPLAEAGLTKADVRRLAEAAGLAVAVKPSSPCMATRFPYDTELTREKLALAAHAEALVREYLPPSANMRVRCVGGRAAIETDPGCFAQLRQAWPELENRLCLLGFAGVEPEVAPFRSGRWDGTGDFQA
jgi:hypothetical protein